MKNTYVQDEIIPIYIFLTYEKRTLKFPVNPESLKIDKDSGSTNVKIEGLGEVSIPTSPKLAKISISSFFWQQKNLIPSYMYVNWLEQWQKSKKPAKLLVTRLNYSMLVTCENFSHEMKAGEEDDIYFTLSMQEYKPYGAKKLKVEKNTSLLLKAKEVLGIAVNYAPPVLIEIPRPARGNTRKETIGNIFTTTLGITTLCAIAKKITGSSENWKKFYDSNQDTLGDIFGNGDEIPVGTEIKVPPEYTDKDNSLGEIYDI